MKARAALVVIGSVIVALAGCADDSNDSTATSESSASTTETTQQSLLESTAATGQVPDVQQLAAMLISEADLDGGWSVNPWGLPATDRSSINFGESRFGQLVCDDAPEDFRAAERTLHWQAFVHLDNPAEGILVEELLWADASPDAVESLYATLEEGFDACMGPADTDDAGGTETREPLAIPEVGDERTGVLIRSERPGWIRYGALVRDGSVLMYAHTYAGMHIDDVEPEFEQLVRTMADKIARNAGSLVFLDTDQPSSTR